MAKKKTTKKKPKTDPFAALTKAPRRITPIMLTGAKLTLWIEFSKRYTDGDFDGLTMADMHDWATVNLGITCTPGTLRKHLTTVGKAST
jgi:hypothetical protein